MQRGDIINVSSLGERQIRKARVEGPCAGWGKRANHQIMAGDLYVETELDPYKAGGYAMERCCLDCINA